MRSDSDSYMRKRLLFAPLYEMYQISVCRVKSKFASSFGFLSKTVAKIQQIFEFSKYRSIISQFFAIFCKDTANCIKYQIVHSINYTSVSKRIYLVQKCSKS